MKILRVALENVNSLAGSWTLDLASPDFRSEAFVVSGPTGSGKTSLLDAVTLALYGRTSRQNAVSKSVNAVMTEGTGVCRAETDFIGVDGLRYRARWEQHRAGNRPSGALQPVSRELLALFPDGAPLSCISAGNEKTAPEIERRVGLSYDQFVRAVVLQQGDFASFLSAKKDERADLLEKAVRDTRFSEAGRRVFAAFQQAADTRQRAETVLAERIGFSSPAPASRRRKLSPGDIDKPLLAALGNLAAARADAIARRDRSAADSSRLATEIAALNAERDWSAEEASLQVEEAALAAKRAETDALADAFAPSRPLYDRAVQARSLDPARPNLELARRRRADEAARHADLLSRLPEAIQTADARTRTLDDARARRETVLADCRARRATLDRAAALDRDLHAVASRLDAARQAERTARAKADRDAQTARMAASGADSAEALLQAARAWSPGSPVPPAFASSPLFASLAAAAAADGLIQEATLAVQTAQTRYDGAKAAANAARADESALLALRRGESAARKELDALKWSLDLSSQRALLHDGDSCPLCGSIYHASAIPPDLPAVVDSVSRRLSSLTSDREAREASRQAAFDAETSAAAALLEAQNRLAAVRLQTDHDKQNGPLALERAQTIARTARADALQKRDAAALSQTDADAQQAACSDIEARQARLQTDLRSLLGPHSLEKARLAVESAEKAAEKAVSDGESRLAAARAALDAARRALDDSSARLADLEQTVAGETSAFLARLAPRFADESDWLAARLEDPAFLALQTTADALDKRRRETALLADTLAARRAAHDAARPPAPRPVDELDRLLLAKTAEKSRADEAKGAAQTESDSLDRRAAAVQDAHRDWEKARALHESWSRLNDWFGGQNGNAFRVYAQGVTLGKLLAEANGPLLAMTSGRFELDWNPADGDLVPVAVDHWQANDHRPVSNLSGGETFLVSLALALALGRLAGKDLPIETLFLDEGFGTLDDDKLQLALETLSSLHGAGCTVGVISHVAAVKTHGFDLVEVTPRGDGTSVLSGPGVSGAPPAHTPALNSASLSVGSHPAK